MADAQTIIQRANSIGEVAHACVKHAQETRAMIVVLRSTGPLSPNEASLSNSLDKLAGTLEMFAALVLSRETEVHTAAGSA